MGKGVARWGVGLLLTALVCGLARPIAGEEKASNTEQPGKTAPGTSLIDSLSFTSRREPIHIRSHDLEFLYNEKRIIYRGDVVATQGDVTVKSDLLTVTYEEPTTEDGAAPPQPESESARWVSRCSICRSDRSCASLVRRSAGLNGKVSRMAKMFSSTVNLRKTEGSCGRYVTPLRARSCIGRVVRSSSL